MALTQGPSFEQHNFQIVDKNFANASITAPSQKPIFSPEKLKQMKNYHRNSDRKLLGNSVTDYGMAEIEQDPA